jgi:hypothetical protein
MYNYGFLFLSDTFEHVDMGFNTSKWERIHELRPSKYTAHRN